MVAGGLWERRDFYPALEPATFSIAIWGEVEDDGFVITPLPNS
jgi:hypothetical protein